MIDLEKSIVQRIESGFLQENKVELFFKRDDLLHQEISGNKWRKLKLNIDKCVHQKSEGILTFGGAYSNHLVATASVCSSVGLKSIGVVRGNELNAESNDTLKRCESYGMELQFISREEYGLRNERYYHEELLVENSNYHVVPEGGANYLGMIGCQEIISEIDLEFDSIFVAQGTTTTSCGLALGLDEDQKIYVVPALKGFDSFDEMSVLFNKAALSQEAIEQIERQIVVCDQYHFGGYGKYTNELLEFIQFFNKEHHIKLDPIYTGKAMFALMDMVKSGVLKNQKVIFIHTGGIQGSQSIIDKTGFNFYS
ncbi:MAG: pyridoxal-phosphate dependent enzyme [Crocinitomicaceae bacterium]|nr:pyridoxal-phosphate dependent enzyme [Crocinitomicaceae bacterium]